MKQVPIELSEAEYACLEELAKQAGITVEEAVRRAIRYVIKEVVPFNQNYLQFRSQMFWEHLENLRHLVRR